MKPLRCTGFKVQVNMLGKKKKKVKKDSKARMSNIACLMAEMQWCSPFYKICFVTLCWTFIAVLDFA